MFNSIDLSREKPQPYRCHFSPPLARPRMAFKLIGYRSVYIWYLVGELLRHDVVTKCVSTHFSFPSLSRVDSTTRGVRVLVRSRRHLDVLFFLFLCQHALSPFPTSQRFQEAGKHTHTHRERETQTDRTKQIRTRTTERRDCTGSWRGNCCCCWCHLWSSTSP